MPHWKEVEQVKNSSLYQSAEWQEHQTVIEELLYDTSFSARERNDLAKEYIDSLGYNDAVNEAMMVEVTQTPEYQSFLDETGRTFGGGGLDNDQVQRDYDRYLEREDQLEQLEQNGSVPPSTESTSSNSSASNSSNSNSESSNVLTDAEIEQQILNQQAANNSNFSLDGNTEMILPDELPATGGLEEVPRILVDKIMEEHPGSSVEWAEVVASGIVAWVKTDAEKKLELIDLQNNAGSNWDVTLTDVFGEDTYNEVVNWANGFEDILEVADSLSNPIEIWKTNAELNNVLNNFYSGSATEEETLQLVAQLVEDQALNTVGLFPPMLSTPLELWIKKSNLDEGFIDVVNSLKNNQDFVEFSKLMQLPPDRAMPLIKDFLAEKTKNAFISGLYSFGDFLSGTAVKLGFDSSEAYWNQMSHEIEQEKYLTGSGAEQGQIDQMTSIHSNVKDTGNIDQACSTNPHSGQVCEDILSTPTQQVEKNTQSLLSVFTPINQSFEITSISKG